MSYPVLYLVRGVTWTNELDSILNAVENDKPELVEDLMTKNEYEDLATWMEQVSDAVLPDGVDGTGFIFPYTGQGETIGYCGILIEERPIMGGQVLPVEYFTTIEISKKDKEDAKEKVEKLHPLLRKYASELDTHCLVGTS